MIITIIGTHFMSMEFPSECIRYRKQRMLIFWVHCQRTKNLFCCCLANVFFIYLEKVFCVLKDIGPQNTTPDLKLINHFSKEN